VQHDNPRGREGRGDEEKEKEPWRRAALLSLLLLRTEIMG
jgi:hypothetical protein